MNHGWSFTLAGAYKTGDGWVDQTNVKAWFFFAKVDKRWGNHITSLTGFGAPQTHTQRSYKRSIAAYDTTYAKEHGVSSEDFPWLSNITGARGIMDQGTGYNQHWGYLKRDAEQWESDYSLRVIDPNAEREVLNEKVNTYFKPQFSLRDSWNISEKFVLSNTIYLSIGNGGGQGTRYSLKNTEFLSPADVENNPDFFSHDEIGQINWQSLYNQNSRPIYTGFG